MTAANRLTAFRIVGFITAALLAVAALFGITAQATRLDIHAASLYRRGAPLPAETDQTARAVSLDGDLRADFAARDAMVALGAGAGPDGRSLNKAAQIDVRAVLSTSPVNALMWTTLGLLRAQVGEPSAPALKASYLTGRISKDALARRIGTVVTGSGIEDEELRLLAQTDIRTILTRYPELQPELSFAYRQAGPAGRAFLIDAARMIDPSFSQQLARNS